jgi:hypothetical protein
MVLEGAMVATACLCLTILHSGVCFKGEWRAANFKLGKRSNAEGKIISISRSDSGSESGREPPQYSESIDDAASIISSRSATVMTSVPVIPGQVHVEIVPTYGIRYEKPATNFRSQRCNTVSGEKGVFYSGIFSFILKDGVRA